jgi:hypothetical protein
MGSTLAVTGHESIVHLYAFSILCACSPILPVVMVITARNSEITRPKALSNPCTHTGHFIDDNCREYINNPLKIGTSYLRSIVLFLHVYGSDIINSPGLVPSRI